MQGARHPPSASTLHALDLPVVAPIAERATAAAGLADRVAVALGAFLGDPLPRADVITMGLILHDWNLERKRQLISSAYEALAEGGVFVIIENLIDDARRENAFGLMMSLNMLIEFGDAFDFTGSDFAGWCREAGFRDVEILPLARACDVSRTARTADARGSRRVFIASWDSSIASSR